MKHGTIVRNMYQPHIESLLVYMGVSGQYARCLWMINGELCGMQDYYKRDILNDRKHFPVVGFVDYKQIMTNAIREGLKQEVDNG